MIPLGAAILASEEIIDDAFDRLALLRNMGLTAPGLAGSAAHPAAPGVGHKNAGALRRPQQSLIIATRSAARAAKQERHPYKS